MHRLTSDGCFSPLCLLKGFISPGDWLFSKHLIIPVRQGHLIPRPRPAESAERTEFDRHTKTSQNCTCTRRNRTNQTENRSK